LPQSPWNYALELDWQDPERSLTVQERQPGAIPFSDQEAPVVLRAKGRILPSWTLYRNAAAPPPPSPVESSEPPQDIELIPYGCTNLRITEFPVLKTNR
jgi:hypothetical protein